MDDILIKSGKIVEKIVGTAKEKQCDLIVIGSHKGFLGSASIGSVAKGVLQKAGIPVLIAPPSPSEAS